MKMSKREMIDLIALISNSLTSIVMSAFMWGTIGFIAYMAYKCCLALSGKTTLASIDMSLLAKLSLTSKVSYVVGGGGVAYGYYERRLRKKTTARLAAINANLENVIDPNRTSSGLTSDGSTKGVKIR